MSHECIQLASWCRVRLDSTYLIELASLAGKSSWQRVQLDLPATLYREGQNFGGGFHPPTFVQKLGFFSAWYTYALQRLSSVISTSSNGIETAWRRRQIIMRGKTSKVKFTRNFIADYLVPMPVFRAQRWTRTSANTTEFSWGLSFSSGKMSVQLTVCLTIGVWGILLRHAIRMIPPKKTAGHYILSGTTVTQEILIAMSYNEDKTFYARTLRFIVLNIRDICKTKQSKYWRQNSEDG